MDASVNLNHNSEDLVANFRKMAENIATQVQSSGIKVKAFHDSSLIHFRELTTTSKQKAIEEAQNYLNSLREVPLTAGAPASLIDQSRSLWLALKYFNLRPTSDLFNYIHQDKAVELYNSDGIQVWRNFHFFKVCGYTIEEIFCFTWQERYERNDFATKQIVDLISQFTRDTTQVAHCSIYNQLRENFSNQRFIIDVLHEYIAPVYDYKHDVAGFVSISDAKVLEAQTAFVVDL